MILRRTALIAAAIALSACASTTPSNAELKRVPPARVFATSLDADVTGARVAFIRDSGMIAALLHVEISVDGKRVAALAAGEYFTINVAAGERQLTAMAGSTFDRKPVSLDVTLKPGQVVVYRVGFEPGGFAPPRMSFNRDPAGTFPEAP